MKFLIDLNSSCFDRYLGFPRLGPSSVMNPPPPPGSCEAPSPLPLMKAPLQTGVLSPPRPGDAVGTLGLLIKVDLLEGSGGPSPPRRHSALGVRGEAVGERPRPQTPRSAAPRHRFWGPQTRQRTPHRLALPHRGPHRSGDPRAPSPMQRHLRKSPSPSAPPRPPGMPYTHHQSPMMLAGQRRMKKSPSWVRERGNILPRLGSSRESRAPSEPPGRAAGLPAASLRQPGAAGPGGGRAGQAPPGGWSAARRLLRRRRRRRDRAAKASASDRETGARGDGQGGPGGGTPGCQAQIRARRPWARRGHGRWQRLACHHVPAAVLGTALPGLLELPCLVQPALQVPAATRAPAWCPLPVPGNPVVPWFPPPTGVCLAQTWHYWHCIRLSQLGTHDKRHPQAPLSTQIHFSAESPLG